MDGDCYQVKHCTALRANFLVESLNNLDCNLRTHGSRLYVTRGDPVTVLPELWKKWGVTHLTFEEDETGEPYAKDRDEKVLEVAQKLGIEVKTFASETLHPLQGYVRKAGSLKHMPNTMGMFQKLFVSMGKVPLPIDVPAKFPRSPNNDDIDDDSIDAMMSPTKPTDLPWPRNTARSKVSPIWNAADCEKLSPLVSGGETKALEQLHKKISLRPEYVSTFEKPKTSCVALHDASTTVMSPYLSLGCISPRKMWYAIEESCRRSNATKSKPPVSLDGQMLWRDFNNLIAFSANEEVPGSWNQIEGNKYCRPIPWSKDPTLLKAWKEGKTGYPWIDACMRQLDKEGWIHHLGRHAVACFLTRGDLWQSWEEGARHFESRLLDADYALNGFNWLWLSCSGFFYQYFRCYSPVAFQKKNDPNGDYIRKYVPELKMLPKSFIYEPWKAPLVVQKKAGVLVGKDYPKPVVDHSVESKENMSKISYAYDLFKESQMSSKKRSAQSSTKKSNKKIIKKQKKITDQY